MKPSIAVNDQTEVDRKSSRMYVKPLDARLARVYMAFPMKRTDLGERIGRVMVELDLTHLQAAVDAGVAPDTLRTVLRGGQLKRPSTIQQLVRWVERSERRLDRRRAAG